MTTNQRADVRRRSKPGDMVLVEWDDAHQHEGWHDIDDRIEENSFFRCETVGWLVHEDERKVVIATSVAESRMSVRIESDISLSSVITIPRGCITGMRSLSVGKEWARPRRFPSLAALPEPLRTEMMKPPTEAEESVADKMEALKNEVEAPGDGK